MTHLLDDGFDAPEVHSVNRFVIGAFGQGSTVRIELGVRSQVHLDIEQLSIDPCERFAVLSELVHCREYIVGSLHCAYLQLILWLVDLAPFAL